MVIFSFKGTISSIRVFSVKIKANIGR